MRRVWPFWAVFCSLVLVACAGTDNKSISGVPPVCPMDYLDRQKTELQPCFDRFNGTQIQRREKDILITLGCDSLFELNSDRMVPAVCPAIDSLAEVVKKYPETCVRVDVHTDCIRSEEENLALSELQAWTLKKALVDRGVAPSRVTSRGWGESKPVASNATEAGRKMNRRVTIILAPGRS